MQPDKKSLGYREGLVSVFLNTGLFALKLWVGLAAGSVAMVADAWHTMSDTLTSIVVVLGFWIASRPRDREHPFGHGRAELIAAVIIGTMLALVGLNFLQESWRQLQERQTAVFGAAALGVFLFSALLKEGLARWAIRAGRRVKSQAIVADGWHHRSDAIASLLILAGGLLGRRFWWIDGMLGILVSLLILYAAFEIIRDASGALMGERPDSDLVRRISELVADQAPAASDIHHIHVHRYGDHIEVTLHARLPHGFSLQEAHQVSTALEERIRCDLNVEPTIHLEPRD